MRTASKIAIGIGLAGSALLAAYLFTGNRKKKTQDFISKTGKKLNEKLKEKLKEALESKKRPTELNHEVDYV